MNKPLILGKDMYSFPRNMKSLVEYARTVGISRLALCERGTSFGYDIVVDMRSINFMQRIAPVFFNASYAFCYPHTEKNFFKLRGKTSMATVLYGAVAQRLAGILMDILPDQSSADSAASGMLTMETLPFFLEHILEIDHCVRNFCA